MTAEPPKPERRRPGLAALGYLAWRDIAGEPIVSLVVLAVLVLAINEIIIPSYYGSSLYHYQKREMAKQNIRQIIATCHPERKDLFFRDDTIAGLKTQIPELVYGAPSREFGVWLSMGGPAVYVFAESVTPDELAVSSLELSEGENVRSADADEVLIPEALYQRLVRSAAPDWDTAKVQLSVSRTEPRTGREEKTGRTFTVAGRLAHRYDDRIYVPLERLREIDMWCGHAIANLAGTESSTVPAETVRVFVDARTRETEFATSLRNLRLDPAAFQEVARATFPSCYGRPWFRVRRTDPGSFRETDLRELAAHRTVAAAVPGTSLVLQRDDIGAAHHTVEAIGVDPHGELAGQLTPQSARHACLVSKAFARKNGLRPGRESVWIGTPDSEYPALVEVTDTFEKRHFRCDVVMARRTLHAVVAPVAPQRRFCLVRTTDRGAYRRLARQPGSRGVTNEDQVVLFFSNTRPTPTRPTEPEPTTTPAGSTRARTSEPTPADRARSALHDLYPQSYRFAVREFPRGPGRTPLLLTIRLVPDTLIERLSVGRFVLPGRLPAILVWGCNAYGRSDFDDPAVQRWMTRRRIAPVAGLTGRIDEVWIGRSWERRILRPTDQPQDGIVVHCAPARADAAAESVADIQHLRRETVRKRSYLVAVRATLNEVERLLRGTPHARPAVSISAFATVPGVRFTSARGTEGVVEVAYADGPPPAATEPVQKEYEALAGDGLLVSRNAFNGFQPGETVTLGADTQVKLVWADKIPLPSGVVLWGARRSIRNHRQTLDRLRGSDWFRPDRLTFPASHVLCTDVVHHRRLTETLAKAGCTAEPLVDIRDRDVIQLRTADPHPEEGEVRKLFISLLRSAKPAVENAFPDIRVRGFPGRRNEKVAFLGTTAYDPLRHTVPLVAGDWMPRPNDFVSTGRVVHPAVLPASALLEASDRLSDAQRRQFLEAEFVGRTVNVRFYLTGDGPGTVRPGGSVLDLKFTVCGVTDRPVGYVPLDLARDIRLWTARELTFDRETNTFATGRVIYERTGSSSGKLYVGRWQDVAPAAEKLSELGYRPQTSLSKMAGLERLGTALTMSSVLVAAGPVILCAVIIIAMTLITNIRHLPETGITIAYGATRGDITRLYVIKGLLMVALSLAIGFTVAVVIEPLVVRDLARSVFHQLPFDDVLTHEVYDVSNWPWFVLAAGVAFVFSMSGVALVIIKAHVTPLYDLLRSRE
jgi:hypothetical protein